MIYYHSNGADCISKFKSIMRQECLEEHVYMKTLFACINKCNNKYKKIAARGSDVIQPAAIPLQVEIVFLVVVVYRGH